MKKISKPLLTIEATVSLPVQQVWEFWSKRGGKFVGVATAGVADDLEQFQDICGNGREEIVATT